MQLSGRLVQGDPADLRSYLVILLAVVAMVVPVVVAAGRGSSTSARWGHATLAVLSTAIMSWYFYVMALTPRNEGAGDVFRSYRLHPGWGGWIIIALTLVILVSAVALTRRTDARADRLLQDRIVASP